MIGPEEGDSKDNLGVISVWVGLIYGGAADSRLDLTTLASCLSYDCRVAS